jgi:uncharacterized membrane protein YeiH
MLIAIDLLGTLAFAITGASKAIHHKLDWLGVFIVAAATGVGGGILRDIMLGATPPIAIRSPIYITVCIVATALTLGAQRIINASWKVVLFADALGLGFFTAVGASKAALLNAGPIAIILMATITASGGGMLRDMLVSEIPQVLKSDFYATAAITGGIFFVLLEPIGVTSIDTKMLITTLFTFALRLFAMRHKLHLPHAD